ncbi:MAG TPA: lipid II flippase MurJ, partial [Pseudohongiella sp.]|nr:lipid II flippase MurJ [Pseudohongiella sp.]
IAMVANMAMNILLVFVLDLAHAGLALATSLSAFLNAGLLLFGLMKARVFVLQPGWIRFAVQMLVANVLMCVFLVFVAGEWQQWLEWDTLHRAWMMAVVCFGGMAVYALGLFLSGVRPADFRRHA